MAAPATDHDRVTTPPASSLEILLGEAPVAPRRGLPDLPDGWQHAVLVRRLHEAEPARREGLLAIGFAVAALLWAPLGVLAVLAGTEGVFLMLSALLAVVLLAPRPAGVATAAASFATRARQRLAGVVRSSRAAGERAGTAGTPSGLDDRLSRWLDGQSTPSSRR